MSHEESDKSDSDRAYALSDKEAVDQYQDIELQQISNDNY